MRNSIESTQTCKHLHKRAYTHKHTIMHALACTCVCVCTYTFHAPDDSLSQMVDSISTYQAQVENLNDRIALHIQALAAAHQFHEERIRSGGCSVPGHLRSGGFVTFDTLSAATVSLKSIASIVIVTHSSRRQ